MKELNGDWEWAHVRLIDRRPHPLYVGWYDMMARCYRPTCRKYQTYGARGIKVCDEWRSWPVFRVWALRTGWKPGLTIHRMDPDDGYKPGNCEWLTKSEHGRRQKILKKT